MKIHPFRDSGYTTLMTGRRICGFCGSLENEKIHQLPETPPEAKELDERKLGEKV